VEECFDVNAKGTANLLDMTAAARKFIYLSTSEVYGDQGQVPFRESMCPRPASPYAITKYAGELYCRMKQRTETGRSIVLLRAFNTYGPYQSAKAVIGELIVNSLRGLPIQATKGEQTREFNFVGDIVDGLIKAANHDGAIDGPVNLGSGQEVAIRDLIAKVVALTGTSSSVQMGAIPYRPNEIWRMCADNTRAREILGWKPSVDLEEGLRQTIDWFRQYLAVSGTLGES
jgi:nucleoside-diphosphate-sugar epimerase